LNFSRNTGSLSNIFSTQGEKRELFIRSQEIVSMAVSAERQPDVARCPGSGRDSAACINEIAENSIRLFFKREPTADEINRFLSLHASEPGSSVDGLRKAYLWLITSPNFLFVGSSGAHTADRAGMGDIPGYREVSPY